MPNGTCVTLGCERPVWVKSTGECSTCQSRRYRRENPGKGRTRYDRECQACGVAYRTEVRRSQFCSLQCKGEAYRRTCRLPADHPVAMLIKVQREQRSRVKTPTFAPEVRECAWCGIEFTAAIRTQVFCTAAHKVKAKRNRRRGRQYGSTSHFTWSEFTRLFIRFDRRCAYCENVIEGQADPDHVVPLSRGGSNSITNILPSCRGCNSDKRDLLLDEWAADRERRGLMPRVTSWSLTDPRVQHLTSLSAAA